MTKKLLTITFCFLLFLSSFSQSKINTDDFTKVIEQQNFVDSQYIKKRVVKFLKPQSKKFFVRYNPLMFASKGLLYFYQKTLSQQFAADCPFEYSCSAFSKECIQQHGFIKGLFLTTDRLMKCNDFLKIDITPFQLSRANRIIDNPSSYKR
jgi:putative membrane protein insertion efficiency factor